MARKKKTPHDVEEEPGACSADAVLVGLAPPERPQRSSLDERQLFHASDSEVFDVKTKTGLQKNKSNLYLIKSYSFIDKTNSRRPTSLNIPQKLQEFENYHTLLLEEASPVKEKEKPKKKEKMEKSSASKKNKAAAKKDKLVDPEDLKEYQHILRNPKLILEYEAQPCTSSRKRPLTISVDNPHKPVVKSKTTEDIETSPQMKRESFIRYSLQSIRRSFSSSKKYPISSSSSSSSAACSSASSTTSSGSSGPENGPNSFKKPKSKTKEKQKHAENIVVKDMDSGCEENNLVENLISIEVTQPPGSCTTNNPLTLAASASNAAGLAVLQEEDEKDLQERSTSSVSTLAQLPTDSLMAPLQTHTEAQSIQCLNAAHSSYDKDIGHLSATSSTQSTANHSGSRRVLQQQLSVTDSSEGTSIGCASSSEYASARSLKHSSTSLAPLQSVPSSASLRSISPSRRSASSNSSSTAKHEQSPAAPPAGTVAASTSAGGLASQQNITPPEKEKKRKEVSSSRVKKFQRHFSQVSEDEKLINYFSCALVSDILLQGHLYITDKHFAFYSNVFGYVTKVVIPTGSVTKISKEKTAKIIPNAVGVATADERHVFGSFISREAAFRLMCSVCQPLGGTIEILPKDPVSIEISEEYSVEDDSSCSISGNESPAQANDNANSTNETNHQQAQQHPNDASQTTLLRRNVGASTLSMADCEKQRHSDIPLNAKNTTASLQTRSSAPAGTTAYANGGGVGAIGHVIVSSINGPATAIGCAGALEGSNLTFIAGNTSTTTSVSTTPTPSTSSPTTVMAMPHSKAHQVLNKFRQLGNKLMVNLKFPTEVHVVYLGAMLTVLLAVFTIFLLYRILDIEAKTSVYRSPIEFNWHSGNDDDIFAEALRFQKQLQVKSTEEAQNILKTNLEQIAKVRRSLETLSMLIHDRSSSFGSPNTDDSD
uniref:GRAM domain-containing protein n=1 Tax=Musca domestica TaxID=7370 RepID=A0A1I8N1I3_MUSDO